MSTIGHNRGPSMKTGTSWQRHCWSKARADLLPTLPIEVVRLRVKRAAEIGLDYRTYASIRATSGHDVIALLFSTNALRMLPPRATLPAQRYAALAAIKGTVRGALVHPPMTPAQILAQLPDALDHATPAPHPFATWREARHHVLAGLKQQGWPADRVVMIGDTSHERDWAQAARLAWYLPADQYFAA